MKKRTALLIVAFLLSSSAALAPVQVKDNSLGDEKGVTQQFSQFLEELRKDLKIPGLSRCKIEIKGDPF